MSDSGTAFPIPVEILLLAYRSGIFPMADDRDDTEIYWVEPRERAIIPLGDFIPSRSLSRSVRRDLFRVTCNQAFADTMALCAEPRGSDQGTWISGRISESYLDLHRAGHAHSIECWQEDRLVGGLYGVQFDRAFCGESMFSRATDASKVALTWLVALLRHAGVKLLDCQFMTPHLARLGAIEISQAEYLDQLGQSGNALPAQPLPDAYAALFGDAGADPGGPGPGPGSSSPGKLILHSLTHTS